MTRLALPLLDSDAHGPSQVCMLVADLDEAMARHHALTGAVFDLHEVTRTTHPTLHRDGRPVELRIRYALSRSSPQLELIQPLDDDNIYADHIAEHGHGFHHVAYLVDDIDEARRRLAAAGLEPFFTGEGLGATGDGAFAYVDTRDLLGAYVELIRPPARRHPALGTFPAAAG